MTLLVCRACIVHVCFVTVLSVDIEQPSLPGYFPIGVIVLAAYAIAERKRQFREFEAQIIESSALALFRNSDVLHSTGNCTNARKGAKAGCSQASRANIISAG